MPKAAVQKMRRRRLGAGALSLGCVGVLLLSACGDDPALVDQDQDTGTGTGGDRSDPQQLQAPDPQGNQLSHDEMRSVLEEHLPGAELTDTDDVVPDLRDLETELQRLVVDPQRCKQYVVESAKPVPEGALLAHAVDTTEITDGDEEDPDDESEQDSEEDSGEDSGEDLDGDEETLEATVYSFEDWEVAVAHFAGEESGVETCDTYSVSRPTGEGEDAVETESSIQTVSVTTVADGALGLTRELTSEDASSWSTAVMLRQGSQIVVMAESSQEEPDEDALDDVVESLQERAAAVLSDLTGEDLTVEEEEDEDEEADEDEGADEADATESDTTDDVDADEGEPEEQP